MPFLNIDNQTRLFYADHYFGPPWKKSQPVLLIHGVAESSQAWNEWVPVLSPDLRVLRPDLRGFGNSSIPEAGYEWSLEAFADDLVRLLDRLEIPSTHVIGAKMGGSVAMQLAAKHPSRVRSLAVISSPVRGLAFTADKTLVSVTTSIREIGVRAWAERTQKFRLGSEATAEQLEYWTDFMAQSDLRVCVEVEEMCAHMDLTEKLQNIQARTLVVTTAASPMQTAGTIISWVSRIPNSKMITVSSSGYHPAATNAVECARAALAHIGQSSPVV